MEIPPVSSIPKVTDRSYTVERVNKVAGGDYKVESTTHYVTTYDNKGRITTTTNTSQMSFLI